MLQVDGEPAAHLGRSFRPQVGEWLAAPQAGRADEQLDGRGLVVVFQQRFGLPRQREKSVRVNRFFQRGGRRVGHRGDKAVIAFLATITRNIKTAVALTQHSPQRPHQGADVTVLITPDGGGNLLPAHPPAACGDHQRQCLAQLPAQYGRPFAAQQFDPPEDGDRSRRHAAPSGIVPGRSKAMDRGLDIDFTIASYIQRAARPGRVPYYAGAGRVRRRGEWGRAAAPGGARTTW